MNWLNRPLLQLNIKRHWRRALILTFYSVFFGLIFLWAFLRGVPGPHYTAQFVTLAGFVILPIIYIALDAATRNYVRWHFLNPFSRRDLDERQKELRNKSYYWGYNLLGLTLALLFNVNERIGLGWTLTAGLIAYSTFPVSVFAWLEPDPIGEEKIIEGNLA